jgi:Amidohydrolase family
MSEVTRRQALKALASAYGLWIVASGAPDSQAADAAVTATNAPGAVGSSPGSTVWLVGGHFVNTAGGGRRAGGDIPDSLIELRGDRFGFVGRRGQMSIPTGARRIDLRGKFVVPGFVDNLGSFGNQSQASANLYFGVTTVITAHTPGDPLRPPTDTSASPSPRAFPIGILFGDDKDGHVLDPNELRTEVAARLASGFKVLDVHYSITDRQLRVLDRIPQKDFGYAAELASAHYAKAVNIVNSLLHTVRYFLGLAPAKLQEEIARDPFNAALNLQLADFYQSVDLDSPDARAYSKMLATGKAHLVPTMALNYYSTFPSKAAFSGWWDRQARRYGITGIPNPSDGVKGDPAPPLVPNPAKMAAIYDLERLNAQHGAKYLVASAASRFGTLPGVSYAIEMQLMADRLGLTPRQALAAATTNFDEAFGFHSVGAIKRGHRSDAVVLDEDPTLHVRNAQAIHAVVLAGRYVPRDEILVPS